MQLTQQQFVADCLAKYRWEPIPSNQKWEEAHYPLPECLGGEETVMLWSADHTVQGLLQSVELDHMCFHGKANKKDLYNLETYYPEYLPLFAQLKSQFSSRRGKKGGKITGANNAKNKTGFCGRSAEQMKADSKKGGKIGGKKAVELGVGFHGRSAEQMIADGKKSAAQRYQCLVTGHISNAGGLARYQKKRRIDTKLRVKLNQMAAINAYTPSISD